MEFWKNIKHVLSKPFPEEDSLISILKSITIISLFVTFFLYAFKPFGLSEVRSHLFLKCLGFGLMTFLTCFVFEFVFSRWLRLKGSDRGFTFGKWIIYMTLLLLCISLANFFYVRFLFGSIQWRFLPDMIQGTFLVGIFPTVAVGALFLRQQEIKYHRISKEINESAKKQPKESNQDDNKVLDVSIQSIRFIEALQNYIRIGYLDYDGQFQEKTERATLVSILNLNHNNLIQCHRSFIVNKRFIESTQGNAQGLLLTLSGCPKEVPVSRRFVADFR